MLTRDQVLDAVRNGRTSQAIDGRDFGRLADFFPQENLPLFGFKLAEGMTWTTKEWSRDAILEQLRQDVEFGFEKALNRRGLSAGAMYAVVKMWMWVLEDELQEIPEDNNGDGDYAQYGLPFLKAVAVKYGFPNPIGEHRGDEPMYSEEDG